MAGSDVDEAVPGGTQRDTCDADGERRRETLAAVGEDADKKEQRECEKAGGLGSDEERERHPRERDLAPRSAQREVRDNRDERGDDEIVERSRRLQRDDRERGEEQRAECGLPSRESDPAGRPVNCEDGNDERSELHEADEADRAGEQHRRSLCDLGVGREIVDTGVSSVRDRADAVLLDPKDRPGEVVRD